MLSFFVHPAGDSVPALQTAGTIALPVAVETSAWAVPVGGEVRVLINQPGSTQTTQLRVLPKHRVEPLPPLPIVVGGAAGCGRELVVTGADAKGLPLVLGVADDGKTTWQTSIDGPTPTLWPVPGCAPQPIICWQTSFDKLEVA